MDVDSYVETISGVSAVDSNSQECIGKFAGTGLLTTAVSMKILPFVAPTVAKGLAFRMSAGTKEPLNIICCENGIRATSQFKEMVILHPEDAIENYTIEDYGFKFATIGQGLFVRKGRLYMPVGVGTEEYPAYLYVWNLKKRCMEIAADLNPSGMGEPEDMSFHKGKYIISAVSGIYIFVHITS